MERPNRANDTALGRRGFLKAGAGIGAAGLTLSPALVPALIPTRAEARPLSEKEKLARIASNTWPIRYIFKSRTGFGRNANTEIKKKYGEITMLDFPQFTKDTFPGVTHMDLFSGLFGDVTDDGMYVDVPLAVGAATRVTQEFDPSSGAGRRWLDKLASKMASTGTKCQHISNNAPRDICDPDVEKRKAGIAVAKKWLDGAAVLGTKSMRVNSGGPRIAPSSIAAPNDYPKADELGHLLANCIESFKEMADYGGKVGVKVTLENHWGLTANPINIRIIVDEVHSPFCEASPDFCNWEHEYLMYNGLKALAPYAHTNVHAKYWNRWKDNNVARSVKIMTDAGFEGTFALEYEEGPWDGIEGSKYLYKEVLAAL
jgi:sugar phosphate isomerase/epimerase